MQKKWFTLIEILIVLLVFSIGVLAVLRLSLQNIYTMSELEARNTATLLAKEWLELVYNTRDSNRIAALPRDCIINKNLDIYNNKICQNHFLDHWWLWTIENWEQINFNKVDKDDIQTNSKLYISWDKTYKYTHSQTKEESIFSRYILFTWVQEDDKIIDTWYILKLESHVIYQKWIQQKEIVLETFIWNY